MNYFCNSASTTIKSCSISLKTPTEKREKSYRKSLKAQPKRSRSMPGRCEEKSSSKKKVSFEHEFQTEFMNLPTNQCLNLVKNEEVKYKKNPFLISENHSLTPHFSKNDEILDEEISESDTGGELSEISFLEYNIDGELVDYNLEKMETLSTSSLVLGDKEPSVLIALEKF